GASDRAVSDACRRPSYFSLLAQREITQRNGLIQSAAITSRAFRGSWSYARLRDKRYGHTAPYLKTEVVAALALEAWQ
ncbi:MAG: hypothetical protein KGI63_09265, partial [Xanthomonadaceae bacterium]|nr:hypothetical protein [Xanthomonadaceae bacterium]